MSSGAHRSSVESGETPLGRLSPAARSVWAKHDRSDDAWLPLWRHMADSGAVAGRLWDEWLPRNLRELIAEALPGGAEDGRRLAVWMAASHDTGKATPAFACQVDPLATVMRDHGLRMLTAKEYGEDRKLAPHGLAGQLILQGWLSERYGFPPRVSAQFAIVAGGHHGTPPTHEQFANLETRQRLLHHRGDAEQVWRRVQFEFADGCAELAGVTERFAAWRSVRLSQPAQVALTALVILSDWVASSAELFPYDSESWAPGGVGGPAGEARRLAAAWEGLDLPGPWQPEEPDGGVGEIFADRFELPPGAEVRPVQAEAVRVAREMAPAGLLMIEAPMGEGKTEAALAAAEILAARSGAGGCLIALPTRATGDAMFPRLLSWLERLPLDGPRSVVLAHAKAALDKEWAGMLRSGRRTIAAVEPEASERIGGQRGGSRRRPAGLHAHQWLRGRKKSLLASFAVGTVDQVLFAGLKSRHLALRHLAVAGKVVVIDEVHAYDAYMNRYLDRVLSWLAAYRVPVVLLSATLPAGRRAALAAAYAGPGTASALPGEGLPTESLPGEGLPTESLPAGTLTADTYPLITAVSPGTAPLIATPAAASDRRTEVRLERLDDGLEELADRLEAELEDGGCALVVRNTVDRVLETSEVLRARFGHDAVTVAHSRFIAADRAARDTLLRERFGPRGARPDRHVVVASQVVEQSLDVDFDLLVTDLAPVDLMLQRMGRLHRHPRTRPPRLTTARCLVTGVDWAQAPPRAVDGSHAVYGAHTLLRALAVLLPHFDGEPVALPEGISPLVQAAYDDSTVGPEAWAEAMASAHQEHSAKLKEAEEKASSFLLGVAQPDGRALFGWIDAGVGDADDTAAGRAQVRDSEDSLEVLVVRQLSDGTFTTVPWLSDGRGGLPLPTDFPPGPRAAEAVAASALSLPAAFSKPWTIDRTIAELERLQIPGWQVKECPWLAGELILALDENCRTRLTGFQLDYSEADGLRVSSADVPSFPHDEDDDHAP
ncbi:CRISPR-associated helicase Cas3' [Streptomyces sp. SM12]|uniref:CRISPR-associated helicase Cas3' n=1 Tax=Streptomyces sp. SM14 TaxID=1736045 RepID=UPI0015E17199